MTEAIETYRGVVVPESVVVRLKRKDRWGSVPGLDDEELASPDELERQVLRHEFREVLALPKPPGGNDFLAAAGEEELGWSAFGTVDFARTVPGAGTSREKADELREQLKSKLIMLAIVKERLPRAASSVLEYLRLGIIDLEHISNVEMLAAARLFLQARRLQKELWGAQEESRRRKERQCERWLKA